MAEVKASILKPSGPGDPDLGLIVDDGTARIVGVYAVNPSRHRVSIFIEQGNFSRTIELEPGDVIERSTRFPANRRVSVSFDAEDQAWEIELTRVSVEVSYLRE